VTYERGRNSYGDDAPAPTRHHGDRIPNRRAGALHAGELLSLDNSSTYPQPDHDQHRGEEEWQTPPPGEEAFTGDGVCKQDRQRGGCETERGAVLRERPVPGTAVRGSVLDREEHRAAPTTSDGEPLGAAQQHQHHRRRHTHLRIGGQQTHGQRRTAHQ
jgi:hypothetical protein